MIGYKDPLSAIVTINKNGRIRIEGSHSEFLFGVTPAMAGYGDIIKPGNRYVDPAQIDNVDMRMFYQECRSDEVC